MTIVVPVPIAPLPVAPYIGDPEFDAHADTHVAALTSHREQVNAISEATYQNALDAHASATRADGLANAAAASEAQTGILAATAAQAVGAQRWQPIPKYYNGGEVVWSPANGQLYRCSAPEDGAVGSYLDPSEVPEDWWLIGSPLSAPILQVAANTNARPGMHYVITAALTLTLPAAPALRDVVQITDLSDSFSVQIDPVGNKIRGANGVMKINARRVKFSLIYSGPDKGWV